MKKILKILIPIFLLAALAFYFRSPLEDVYVPVWNNLISTFFKPADCSEPIPYNIGTFSNQFNISQSYFLSALFEAENIWEKPVHLNLFVYSPADTSSDVLKINLIYDYREQATTKLASLGIAVKDTRASYNTLKAKLTSLKAQYEEEKSKYEAQVQQFDKDKAAYESEVDYWNKKGGAPEAEYNKIQADRVALDNELSAVKAEESHINSMVDEINALVVVLNRLVTTLNLSVDKYNTINVARGESFEEGVYSTNGLTSTIDIYEFSSREKLVRVLAHELGHALGLDHVKDPKAIMYEFNQGNNSTLTQADLEALKAKCNIK